MGVAGQLAPRVYLIGMPSAEQILRGLTEVANGFLPLALAWHVVLLSTLAAFALGLRSSRRAVGIALALPLISVSAVAWATGNPFNGVVFAALAASMLVVARGLGQTKVELGPPFGVALGSAALAYAWIYPHFLDGHSAAIYLIASPMGLLPCPTLSMVLGIGLLAGGFGSRSFVWLTAGAGIFYGVFGIAKLGVWLDVGLLLGALATLRLAFGGQSPKPRAALPSGEPTMRSSS